MPFASEVGAAAPSWFGWPQAAVAIAGMLLGWTFLMSLILFWAAATLGPEAVIRVLAAAHGRGQR